MKRILLVTILLISAELLAKSGIYIRVNQVGFLTRDLKTAVVLSDAKLDGSKFQIYGQKGGKAVFEGTLNKNLGPYASVRNSYQIDFSQLTRDGKYFILIKNVKSPVFTIGRKIYSPLLKSLMEFFKIQRCGYTNPEMHKVCHISDVTRIIDGEKSTEKKIDVTGGWHDAGDYVKFFNTTAYTTYILLFAYDYDPIKFGFDNDNSGAPDVLEEAKIGLDWLLRSYIGNAEFISQIQDLRDHDVGWRLPENDELGFDRPGFIGRGKNLIGLYSATMALASKIWKEKFKLDEFANKCLSTAEEVFALRNSVPDLDTSGTGMYLDKTYNGKLALGAIELYNVTRKSSYLKNALSYAEKAGSDYWWSWGDINALADYKLARISPKYLNYLESNLKVFNETKNKNLFNEAAEHNWGSNNTLLGVGLQAILWKKITHKNDYDSLITLQRDFVLGRNPWGISFIYKTGTNYSKNFHHQIAYFNNGKLPGGFAAGPVKKSIYEGTNIKFETTDKYSKFQTDVSYYRDDRNDYISNEPTISANATAIFLFGYFIN